MTASASDPSSAATVLTPADERADCVSPELVDESCRWPVLAFVGSALIWLLLGLFLSFLVAVKLHVPGFLSDTAWLTVGRLRPAATNALLYGFLLQALFPIVLWMICRLGGMTLLNRSLILFAGAIWNTGVAVGLIAILAGRSSGFTWLEMPMLVVGLLFTAYALMAIWALITFHYRRQRQLYVSQWYFVAALFAFPWIYSAANYLLLRNPVRGVMQVVVDSWYTNNLLTLCLGPMALGIIFYFLPKLVGRPLYSQSLAALGFWSQFLFGAWTGLSSSVGAPLPVWMISASTAASLVMIIPWLAVIINWHFTLQGRYARAKSDLTLRFMLCAAVAFVIGAAEKIVLSCPIIASYTELTFVGVAWTQLMLLGFVGWAIFGAIYYIVPRVARTEWPSAKLSQVHFGLTVGGVALYFLALTVGGLLQGSKMRDPNIDILRVMKMTVPFVGLGTLATLLILAGQVALMINFVRLMKGFCRVYCAPCCSWTKFNSLVGERGVAENRSAEVRP